VRELAGDGDRGDRGALAATLMQFAPAGVQASLGAPGDVDARGDGTPFFGPLTARVEWL
jgi:hypothetical protein